MALHKDAFVIAGVQNLHATLSNLNGFIYNWSLVNDDQNSELAEQSGDCQSKKMQLFQNMSTLSPSQFLFQISPLWD